MRATLINTAEELEQIRLEWDALFQRDTQAYAFQSWPFQRGWFDVSPYPWAALTVRRAASDSSPLVGILPLSMRGSTGLLRIDQVRELHLGGSPLADYTGMVIDPGCEGDVLRTMAEHVNALPWDRLRFQDVRDDRMDALADHLRALGHTVDRGESTGCPFIALPATWEEYLATTVSYETRKSLRKKMKHAQEEFTFTVSSPAMGEAEVTRHVDSLMAMALKRTRSDMDVNLPRAREPMLRCACAGTGVMLMLWKDRQPVAGMATFMDRPHASLQTWITSFDEDFREASPGRVINGLTIKYAIEQGCTTLDFLRGEEEYKMQFGATVRRNVNYGATRSSLHTAARLSASRLRERLGL